MKQLPRTPSRIVVHFAVGKGRFCVSPLGAKIGPHGHLYYWHGTRLCIAEPRFWRAIFN